MSSPWWFDLAEDSRTPKQIAAASKKAYTEAVRRAEQRDADREASRARFKTTEQIIDAAIADAKRGDEGAVTFGWPTIDAALARPIRPGEVVLIAARTGVGKTWIAQHAVERALRQDGQMRALFANLEMSHEQMGVRVAGHALGMSPREVDQRAYRDELKAADVAAYAPFMDRAIWHEDPCSSDELVSLHEQAADVAQAHVGLIIVDYLGLLAWKGRAGVPLYERASENARALKQVAKQTRSVVLACVQLSRAGGRDGSTEPDLASLRDSGATEEAADRVLMFWRPQAEDGGQQLGDQVEIRGKVAKNRHGPLGRTAQLTYDYALRLEEVEEAELYRIQDNAQVVPESRDLPDDLPY